MAMDFDLDDPLGDLLSDGSNDSFFGTSKKPEQKPAKDLTSTTASAKPSSAKVANLFGIDNDTNTVTTSTSNANVKTPQSAEPRITSRETDINTGTTLSSRQPSKPSTPSRFAEVTSQPQPQRSIDATELVSMAEPARAVKKEATQFDDSDDFLNELGFDPKHPKGSSIAKKSNILDDILNFSKPESLPKTTTSTTPPSTPMPSTPKPPSDADGRRSTRSMESGNPSTNRYSPSLGSQGRPRRSGGSGPAIADPLGLFTTPTKKSTTSADTKSTESILSTTRTKPAKKSGIDWLGLGNDDDEDEKPKDSVPQFLTEAATAATAAATAQPIKPQNSISAATVDVPSTNDQSNVIGVDIASSASATATADMAAANLNLIHVASLGKEQALHSLQQQQTQLRVATQMKQQESMLHDMHRKQQMLIKQQENQFNELLQRQIHRQSQLEAHIQHQQEQINAYISTLMSHPSISMTDLKVPPNGDIDHIMGTDGGSDSGGGGRSNREVDEKQQHLIELEAEVKRLGLEKLRLEDTLQSVQGSHEQELDLLHSSHK